MSDTLIQKIQQDAAHEIAEIKAAGAAKVAAIVRETDAVVADLTNTHTIALKKRLAQSELVAVAKAKQAAKIAVQTAKRAEIEALFMEVSKELVEQPAAEYVAYFAKYAASLIPKTTTVIEVTAPAARIAETKDILTLLGFSGEVVGDARVKAGFILRATDGVYDITLDRLVGEKRAELEMEIVKKVMA